MFNEGKKMLPPKILVFTCNWDGWSCMDAALQSGLKYPASVSLVKLSCLSAVNAGSILRAFEYDADGVMLMGCLQHQCPHGRYYEDTEIELSNARQMMQLLGIGQDRIRLARIEPFDGSSFVRQLDEFTASLQALNSSAAFGTR
jgi:coenzyme F420-reducing hydrogenase delta subunit